MLETNRGRGEPNTSCKPFFPHETIWLAKVLDVNHIYSFMANVFPKPFKSLYLDNKGDKCTLWTL